MNPYPRELSGETARVRSGRLLLVGLAALLLVLGSLGCGGKKPAETDPTDIEPTPTETMDDVDLGEDPMGGATTDTDGADSEDIQDPDLTRPAVVLRDVFFDYDEYDLGEESRDALASNSRLLRDNPSVRVLIEGHCDERGTIQYNLALGEKRANEVRGYLVNLGISAGRLDVVSYGKERPFAMGQGEEVWSQNRRAHFVVR